MVLGGVVRASARSLMVMSACNGTVGYQKCLNASSLPSYPQKIAVGSRSISCRRSSMCGDGGSCS